jgi:hypothetical protein
LCPEASRKKSVGEKRNALQVGSKYPAPFSSPASTLPKGESRMRVDAVAGEMTLRYMKKLAHALNS